MWRDTTWLTAASPLAGQPGGVFEYLDDMIESALLEELGLMADGRPGVVPVIAGGAPDGVLRQVRLLGARDGYAGSSRGLPAVSRRRIEKGDVPVERFADLAEELVEREDFAGPDLRGAIAN